MINLLRHNFWLVVENWQAQLRAHRHHRKMVKEIRKHGKELKMRKAEADALHKATKKTYWIIPDYNGVLQVLDKSNLRNLKRAKIMSEKVTVYDLLMESEYSTMSNYFVVLMEYGRNGKSYEFFRGTILECIAKYEEYVGCTEIQILGGYERIVTIKHGKVIKH